MKRCFWSLMAGVCLFGAGCKPLFGPDVADRKAAGKLKETSGDYTGAIALYETTFSADPAEAAALHYELALLYDGKLRDPMGAVYHLRRYLALQPEGAHAADAKRFIKEAELQLGSELGVGATLPQAVAVRLKNENLALQKQVMELRTELERLSRERAQALKMAGIVPGRSGEQVKKPLVPGVRTYTVVSGDTLGSISKRFYKTSARWRDIQDANFNPMKGTAELQPGMVLMIP